MYLRIEFASFNTSAGLFEMGARIVLGFLADWRTSCRSRRVEERCRSPRSDLAKRRGCLLSPVAGRSLRGRAISPSGA